MQQIIEQFADTQDPQYQEAISYIDELTDKERLMCLTAFNNALNIGVSTYKYGDRLVEEAIYNHVLNKLKLITTLVPITAFATIRDREFVICVSPYSLYKIAAESLGDSLDETTLTGYYRAIIKHELLHIMLKHLISNPTRNIAFLVNMVTDALINNMVAEFTNLHFEFVTPEDIIEGNGKNGAFIMASEYALKENLTWEQYYDYLLKLLKDKMDKFAGSYKGQEEYTGEYNTKQYNTEGDISPKPASELPDDVVESINELCKEVAERTRGLSRFKYLEKMVVDPGKKPEPSWKNILRKIFNGNSIMDKKYSMKRIDKRTDLPPGKKYTYRGGTIYVFIDTSGSVDDKQLKDFATEVHAIMKRYKYRYRVFNFSVGVTNEVDIRKLRSGKYEVTDRGGTSILEALAEVLKNNKEPDIFIVFTDLYDDVPTPNDFCNKEVIYALTSEYSKSALETVKRHKYKYVIIKDK